MRNILVAVLLVACAITFTAPAYAAPADMFADVPANHWAYDAVKQLAKAGIVDGYDGRLFKGDRTVTRYEMAQIVANAITKSAKADAAQKKLIEKLSQEFATELAKLGARVDKLEADKPNLKIGGQARFAYTYRDDTLNNPFASYWGYDPTRHNYFSYRLRLEFSGQPDPNLQFFARLTAQDLDVTTGSANYATPVSSGTFNDPKVELFWVRWKMGQGWSVTAGRQPMQLGKFGLANVPGNQNIFSIDYATPKLSAKIGYWSIPGTSATNSGGSPNIYFNEINQNNVLLSQLQYTFDQNNHIDVFNMHELSSGPASLDNSNFGLTSNYHLNLTSIGYDTKVSDKIAFYGEYAKNTAYNNHATSYWFGFTNGNPKWHPGYGIIVPTQDWKKPGSNAQALIYRYYGGNSLNIYTSTLNAVLGNNTLNGGLWLTNTKGIEFYSQNVVAKDTFFLFQIGQADNIDTGKRESRYATVELYLVF